MKTKTFLALLAFGALAAVLPVSAQYSPVVLPRIVRTVEPIFPAGLLPTNPKGGHARLVLEISSTGELKDVLVIGYTARGFADEAVFVAKRWRYEPARVNGERISSSWELLVTFEPTGSMVSMLGIDTANELVKGGFGDESTYRPHRLDELDRLLVATRTVQPAYTKDLQEQGLRGEVTLDFYVDEEGNVRMPFLQTTENNALGVLAGAALREWKFERPTIRGRPVLVKARQTFRFTPASTAPAGE